VNTNQIGWMKANHAGTKIISAIRYMQTFELFDFDKSTGMLSNFVSFGTNFDYPYGVEFSPDDSKVYICGGLNSPNYIMQADMNAGSGAAIVASLTLISNPVTSAMGAIQLGPDCKIYAARYGTTQLGVINNPNAAGAACNYVDNQVNLTTGSCQLGLPNFFEMSCCQIPSFSLGPDTTICQGQTITLTGDTAMAYLWSTGDTTQSITVSVSGTYWLEASNGPCSVTDTITVTVAGYPVISLGPDTSICQGQALTLSGPAATSYLWSTGATAQTIGVSTSGTYWLQAANGYCASTDTMVLTVISIPVAALGPDTTICQGQTLNLTGGTAASYLWSTGDTTQSIAVTAAGTYWLQAANGPCAASDTIVVAVSPYPSIALGPDTILCQGQSVTLSAGAAASYAWSTGATTQSITVSSTGNYWVLAANGQCAAGDTVAVTVNTYPVVDLGPDSTLCDGESLTLAGGTASSYLWSTGATGQSIAATANGTYWLQAGNDHCISSDTVEVSFLAVPAPSLGSDTVICIDATLTLNGGTASSYLWSTGETTATITVAQAGTYWLVSNNAQCSGSDTVEVGLENCLIVIEMPNVFTPNGDGLNEFFVPIKYEGILQADLRVYNRWGVEVYYNDNVLAGWNGLSKGKACPAGTYFWVVRYTTRENVTDAIQGYLSLIR